MLERNFSANIYIPTSPRTGETPPTMLRLGNMILTGLGHDIYLQCYAGTLNLSETIPTLALTGTVSIANGSKSVVGTGTAFKSELRSGQRLFVGAQFMVVDKITDDTHLTLYKAVDAIVSAATVQRLPVLYEIQNQRGTQIAGNAVESDKGTILGAGFGTVRINGSVLPGGSGSMVLSGSPKIAIFDNTANTYTTYALGLTPPTTSPVITSVAGGTHNMQAGNYSLRLVPSRTATNGYGNPGPQVAFTIAAATNKAKVDVSANPAMDTAHGQNEWDVYATENINSIPVNVQGPWNFVRTVTQAEITAGPNFFYIEYSNSEINRNGLLDFNNDTPPSCGYVAFLEGEPVWISCRGKLSDTFGPSIRPGKPQNIEAAPADWDVRSTPPQNILGVTTSLARLYFPSPASLQQGVYLGSSDPFQIVPSVSMRPYWHVGFAHENQLAFVLGDLYGYPHAGPTRSTADVETVSEQFFGEYIAEITKDWIGAHVFVGYDPQLRAICFFHSADSKNGSGFWRTRVLIWGIKQQGWIGDVYISSSTRDMCVCGVATVNEHLQFLAGGRLSSSIQVDTFQFNTATGESVPWYAAWQGVSAPSQNLSIRATSAIGKFTNGLLQIFGFDEEVEIDYSLIENGTGALIDLPMTNTTGVVRKFRERFNAPNCGLAILRVSGTWDGTGDVDRVDKGYMAGMPTGNRR
jgi:hypothetical protein